MALRGSPLLPIVSAAALASCAQVIGIDDWTPGTSVQSGASSASGGGSGGASSVASSSAASGDGGGCPDCIADAPMGWIGPVIRYDGPDPAPDCPEAWLDAGVHAQRHLVVPRPQCSSCVCGTPTGACQVVLKSSAASGCGVASSSIGIGDGICSSVGVSTQYVSATVAYTGSGTCAPSGGVLAATSWDAYDTFCLPPRGAVSCEGGTCAPIPPPPFGASYCILAKEDTACPPGPYTKQELLYEAATDSRACAPCGCGAANVIGCGGEVTLFQAAACSTEIMSIDPTGPNCSLIGGVIESALWSASITGICPAQGGEPSGSAAPTGPVTVCCKE